ncbi:hypothetical protein BC629DRAFT_1507352 [Irpex lacteus]|nr:hypothetical protein BC629DRAFT_1507352 [Irpex lacteus]
MLPPSLALKITPCPSNIFAVCLSAHHPNLPPILLKHSSLTSPTFSPWDHYPRPHRSQLRTRLASPYHTPIASLTGPLPSTYPQLKPLSTSTSCRLSNRHHQPFTSFSPSSPSPSSLCRCRSFPRPFTYSRVLTHLPSPAVLHHTSSSHTVHRPFSTLQALALDLRLQSMLLPPPPSWSLPSHMLSPTIVS